MIDHQVLVLANGIRVLFKPFSSPITHCCFVINAGSRDEAAGKEGLAHFIEHLLFKGTSKRNTSQILNRLEVVGADLNAYTTKEYTCLHVSLLSRYLERAIDLFEDVLFHSTFLDEELEKERGVILDEIASYLDQPEEAIQDDFEELLFPEHPIGKNILGTIDSVSALSRQDIIAFLGKGYRPSEIVFAVSGNHAPEEVLRLAEKYLGWIPAEKSGLDRVTPPVSKSVRLAQNRPINQFHCVMGTQAYSVDHPCKTGLLLLNNLLGGAGMSNRLNLEIREKYGIAYTIESNYIPLSDTGIFSIYFGTDAEKAARAEKLVQRELDKLCRQKLGTVQLQQAKQKFNGQIALAEENRIAVIISMAKCLLDLGYVDTLEDVFAKVNAVTAEQLLEISNEILGAGLSTLIFVPTQ